MGGECRYCRSTLAGLVPEAISNYLFQWDLNEYDSDNAYADDEFPYNDCWQITDFMRRLGLAYPIDDDGKINGRPPIGS